MLYIYEKQTESNILTKPLSEDYKCGLERFTYFT